MYFLLPFLSLFLSAFAVDLFLGPTLALCLAGPLLPLSLRCFLDFAITLSSDISLLLLGKAGNISGGGNGDFAGGNRFPQLRNAVLVDEAGALNTVLADVQQFGDV